MAAQPGEVAMQSQALITTFSGPAAGSLLIDAYWLRIEQEKKDDRITSAEVAELVETLYDIDPCIVAADTGEEERTAVEAKEKPERKDIYATAKALYGDDLIACRKALTGDYTARLRIYRSHQTEDYRLVLSVGKIIRTVRMTEAVSLTIDIKQQSSVTLDYPVLSNIAAGWLGAVIGTSGTITPPKITASPSGAVLSWGGITVTGTLRVEFTTGYDLVEVEIPGVPYYPGSPAGKSQDARCLAFYHFMIFKGEIEPPPEDETVSNGVLRQLCGYDDSGDLGEVIPPETPEDDPENQPQYGCIDWAPGLAEPSTFKELCCVDNSSPYACMTRTERNPGGKEISQEDIEKYTRKPHTEFIPVQPDDPRGCGTIYWRLRVDPKHCCDEVEPLAWDYEANPDILPHGQHVTLFVLDGKSPYTWRTSNAHTRFSNNQQTIVTAHGEVVLYADDDLCGGTMVTVSDGCTKVGEALRSDLGHWELMGEASYDYDDNMAHSGWGTPCVLGGWALGSQTFNAGSEFASDARREFDIVSGIFRQIEHFVGYYRLPRKCYNPSTACIDIELELQRTQPPNTHFCMSMNPVWVNGGCGRTDYGIRQYSGYCYLGPVEFGQDFATFGMASRYQAGYKWSCP